MRPPPGSGSCTVPYRPGGRQSLFGILHATRQPTCPWSSTPTGWILRLLQSSERDAHAGACRLGRQRTWKKAGCLIGGCHSSRRTVDPVAILGLGGASEGAQSSGKMNQTNGARMGPSHGSRHPDDDTWSVEELRGASRPEASPWIRGWRMPDPGMTRRPSLPPSDGPCPVWSHRTWTCWGPWPRPDAARSAPAHGLWRVGSRCSVTDECKIWAWRAPK
jgi:hypothetical protein